MEDEPNYTIQQAANLTRYSKSTLRRWDREGRVTPRRTLGSDKHPGYRVYTEADIRKIKGTTK